MKSSDAVTAASINVSKVHHPDGCPFEIHIPDSDYSVFGESFAVRVPVVEAPDARLLWVNFSWFKSHGINLDDAAVRQRVKDWLLGTFAVTVAHDHDENPGAFAAADRYGETGGAFHGGSGRCVYIGRFNVKGVGPTPLVPDEASNHSDGRLPLLEAMRGALFAELAFAEAPHSAIRTIAVIDISAANDRLEDKRCLSVRSNFVRPGHLERSLFFGTSGFAGSDQYKDHQRVLAVREALGRRQFTGLGIAINIAEEVGGLDAMRMSMGRFTSTNQSIHGEVADFDSFRVFDDWFYTKNATRDKYPFGKELFYLEKSAFAWTRILGSETISVADLRHCLRDAHRRGFCLILRKMFGRDISKDGISLDQEIYSLFLGQSDLRSGEAWILDNRISVPAYVAMFSEFVRKYDMSREETCALIAKFNLWRCPRDGLSLFSINETIEEIVRAHLESPEMAYSEFAEIVARNRRVFQYSSIYMAPIAIGCEGGNVIIAVFDTKERICAEYIVHHAHCDGREPRETLQLRRSFSSLAAMIEELKASTRFTLVNDWIASF